MAEAKAKLTSVLRREERRGLAGPWEGEEPAEEAEGSSLREEAPGRRGRGEGASGRWEWAVSRETGPPDWAKCGSPGGPQLHPS